MAIVHLIVLIHGLWGAPSHMLAAKEELEREWAGHTAEVEIEGPSEDPIIMSKVLGKGKEELVIMIAGGMTSQLTYDGIDVCASRVAFEVDEKIADLEVEGKEVSKISVTGYSLGGLVARYLLGLWESRDSSFFDKHRPISFSTIASPHLGIPRYNTLISTVLGWVGSRLMSRSGEQLWASDRYSDGDSRPLLEIMADPRLVFYHALEQFQSIQIYASAVNDNSVPYPSAAIDPVDHFVQWDQREFEVETDEAGIIQSWRPSPDDVSDDDRKGKKTVKHSWSTYIGTLPPVLRYRYPYNYLILLLFPIMLPLIIVLIVFRQGLDTRRSQRRLQQLAKTSHDPDSPGTPIPTASGLSVTGLRDAIRRVERELESDLIDSFETSDHSYKTMTTTTTTAASADHRAHPDGAAIRVRLSDSQMRMALWLNQLPISKFVTWWPEVGNAHATIVVRNPKQFPAHERGRGLLRHWARRVLQKQSQVL